MCPHPHYCRSQFCFAFFSFSPLPNSPRRSQRPCLQDLVLPSPLCPDQDVGDSPLPAPGPGLRAVGDILVFNQQKAPGRAKAWSRGAYLNFWLGRPRQPASALLLLPEAAFWWPPVDSALCRLPCPVVRVGAAWGRLAPFPLAVGKAVKSVAWVARRRGPLKPRSGLGFGLPLVDGACVAPWAARSWRRASGAASGPCLRPSPALLTLWMRQQELSGASLPTH